MVLEKLRLDGRVAIVTGGSRGLGREMALSLAAAGAEVCIASRTPSQLEATAAFIESRTGRPVLAVPTNVQSSTECDAMVATTTARFGRLDIMVNNAGIGDRKGAGAAVWDLSDDDWEDAISVNLHSAFYCSRAAVRHMRERGGGGVILNVASGTAMRAYPVGMGYGAAKAGVIALTKTLSAQLADDGIRVNCIVPGFLAQHPAETQAERDALAARGRFNTARRLGEAWEMGPLAVFLCSDAASYVTGQSFVIDGGGLAGGIAPVGHGEAAVGNG
ncbi:MAG: SDR family oxidoreductase [Chloroflexi bacterium]|nr:SDR family oxidoreductase [Chloroflexota bacterium]